MDVKRLAMLVLIACGCDAPATQPQAKSIGTLTVMLAGETREYAFASADCGDTLTARDGQDRILVQAFISEGEKVAADSSNGRGAAAYLYDVEYQGRNYDTLMLLAMPVEQGSKTFECTRVFEGEDTVLTCNNAAVRPWFVPGEVPNAAFRLKVDCTK